MSLLPRLALLLFALALLPGAPVHAHVLATASAGMAAPSMDTATASTCHEAPASIPPGHDAQHGAGTQAGDPASATDCCDGTTDPGGCGSACACPSAVSALPLPPLAATISPLAGHDGPAGTLARSGQTQAPPDRPPIG